MSGKYVFSNTLREVRFLFCQTSEQSAPLRSFITRAYPTMKKHNPNIPIMIREAAGTIPKVFVRYDKGVEAAQQLDNLSDKEIESTITKMVQEQKA